MRKKILVLLALFSCVILSGGLYLLYSFERSFSDLNDVINLHQVENLREHLLQKIQKVELGLYSQTTLHPESRESIEFELANIDTAIKNCFNCHHAPTVQERLDDLDQQIQQYRGAVTSMVTLAGRRQQRQTTHIDAHIIAESLLGKLETMVVATSEKLASRTDKTLQKADRMNIIMLCLLAAGPLMMIAFAVTVIRGVAHPVQMLLEATDTLKTGNLEHRVPELKDEFGRLAVAFNEMATALRMTMDGIEESEKRYRLLFESAADAIFILETEGDRMGRILQANRTAAEMHGYAVNELVGMQIQQLDTPESASNAAERMRRMLAGEWIKLEMYHRRKDGTMFPVEISAGLLETGGRRYILAIDRDITERKRIEQELQRMERIRVSGELAAGLAHEIKNPLAGIKVSMEVLSQEASLSEEDREVVRRVAVEIKRIEVLMSHLLNFAQPPKPHLLSTDVNAVLDSVSALVLRERSRVPERQVRLVRDLREGLPEIMADPMQLKQIFMNLMLNAIEAMPDGGTLTLRTTFDAEAASLSVEVSDTGRGIDLTAMGRIFEPFFTTKPKGTGLGLSITKRLIEEHGGTVSIGNNDRGGATCLIRLPARQPEGAAAA